MFVLVCSETDFTQEKGNFHPTTGIPNFSSHCCCPPDHHFENHEKGMKNAIALSGFLHKICNLSHNQNLFNRKKGISLRAKYVLCQKCFTARKTFERKGTNPSATRANLSGPLTSTRQGISKERSGPATIFRAVETP